MDDFTKTKQSAGRFTSNSYRSGKSVNCVTPGSAKNILIEQRQLGTECRRVLLQERQTPRVVGREQELPPMTDGPLVLKNTTSIANDVVRDVDTDKTAAESVFFGATNADGESAGQTVTISSHPTGSPKRGSTTASVAPFRLVALQTMSALRRDHSSP